MDWFNKIMLKLNKNEAVFIVDGCLTPWPNPEPRCGALYVHLPIEQSDAIAVVSSILTLQYAALLL